MFHVKFLFLSSLNIFHMKNQALFSSKDKTKKIKCHLLQFLFGALGVELVLEDAMRA